MSEKSKEETEMIRELLVGKTAIYAGEGGEGYKGKVIKLKRTRFDNFVWWFKYELLGLPQKRLEYTIVIEEKVFRELNELIESPDEGEIIQINAGKWNSFWSKKLGEKK